MCAFQHLQLMHHFIAAQQRCSEAAQQAWADVQVEPFTVAGLQTQVESSSFPADGCVSAPKRLNGLLEPLGSQDWLPMRCGRCRRRRRRNVQYDDEVSSQCLCCTSLEFRCKLS